MIRTRDLIYFVIIALCTLLDSSDVNAQKVRAVISSREAYVGMPIVLQIQVSNASDYQMPELPTIDGCKISAAGRPSQSSQITIINGRRSENRSVTLQYLITPQRPGKFKIPSFRVKAEGKTHTIQPIDFVATESETGDLMFVEVSGKKQQVYVGEPLELNLKIWLKPFRDRQRRLVLNDGQMWQQFSDRTSWGSFEERTQEMASNRQRPKGTPVIRKDEQGNDRGYYLYEIDATVYPTRPGKIDASDVNIVVNYPTEIGQSRDPFSSVFEDRFSVGSSTLRQMMDDDSFGSAFGRGLRVKSARPIVAAAKVDSTEVLPIPNTGMPNDYRGAVGRYRIVADANPKTINAGDPITLRIGVVGDGPMELLQAPPLAEIDAITKDFKVTDQSLAGFVRDESKVFTTTIRPRRKGIAEIPSIPFTFFDPAQTFGIRISSTDPAI